MRPVSLLEGLFFQKLPFHPLPVSAASVWRKWQRQGQGARCKERKLKHRVHQTKCDEKLTRKKLTYANERGWSEDEEVGGGGDMTRMGRDRRWGSGEGAGSGMTCMNSKASRGKGGFAIHFEACSTSVSVT